MKFKILFLLSVLFFTSVGICQYTPLPKLDETEYNNFIAALKIQAVQQDLPELNVIADKMTYDEARRFMANPHIFAEQLKNPEKQDATTELDAIRTGIIVNLLFNHLTGLSSGVDSEPKLGYALGMYALFTLGTVYLLSELLFTYRVAGEKSGSATNILKISYITLFTTLVYAVTMNTCRWLIGAGPVFGFGIAGKQKYESGGTSGESELEFGDNGLQRFQAGVTLMTGFILRNSMLVYLAYSLFFTDLFSNGDVGMNMFRFGLGIPLN